MSEKEISKKPSGRVSRTPISQRNVLTVKGKTPEFEYRIVNDSGDRIAAFEEAGWIVEDASKVRVGDKRVNNATPEGTAATVSVGAGQKAVVMKIPVELYKEDQEAKLQRVRELEGTMKRSGADITHK